VLTELPLVFTSHVDRSNGLNAYFGAGAGFVPEFVSFVSAPVRCDPDVIPPSQRVNPCSMPGCWYIRNAAAVDVNDEPLVSPLSTDDVDAALACACCTARLL